MTNQIKNRLFAVVLGLALTWASVVIAGIGAAVVIPAGLFREVTQYSSLLALALVDLMTIAIPLAAAYLVVAFASKMLLKKPDVIFYALLLAPMLLLQLYFLFQPQQQLVFTLLTTLPRYLLLAVCFYGLARGTKQVHA